jgi:hypothetical protein
MAKKNLADLQRALEPKPEPPRLEPERRRTRRARSSGNGSSSQIAPSREGKVPLIAYVSPAYKRSLRLIQAKQENPSSNQALIAEALNMLFQHYKVPTVSE